MSCDILRLRNMRFFAHHGLFAAEKELGQHFEVDVELHRDLSAAGRADDPDATPDYARVYETVRQVVTGQRFKLVEAVAEHVARAIGEHFAPVDLVVRVRKPDPPLEAHFDGVEVELRRSYA